jgi:TfoX/Sxy family transcriptional regulator of competence genes
VAYDEELADRIRDVLPDPGLVQEKKMFGGLVFMRSGHMCCGVLKEELMLRLGPDGARRALTQRHVREMDFTGRPSMNMVLVDQAGLEGDALAQWVEEASAWIDTLPPRPAK